MAVINGTENDDNLLGTDVNDQINGLGGNDTIDGGAGIDTMVGGLGNDTYYINVAGETITESFNSGIDTVYSGITYTLGNNVENLILTGSNAINGTGNTLNNSITGNIANNLLSGGTGADTLSGGLGADTYTVDNVGDVVIENLDEGIDLVNSSVTYTLGANVENLTLTGFTAINGTGNDLDNTLTGNSGTNILTGLGGNDKYIIQSTTDQVIEDVDAGIDTVQIGITYTLGNNIENLILTGTTTINGTGNALDNSITGNTGNNILDGGLGADTLIGGRGGDTYYIDNSNDVIIEGLNVDFADTLDRVNASVNYTISDNIEYLTLTGTANIDGTGNTERNTITGNIGDNIINAGGGEDYITAGDGNDVINGEDGNDNQLGGNGNDTINGGLGNDILKGEAGADSLIGGEGNDGFDGGIGNDTMIGGLGNDSYTVDSDGDVVIENFDEGIDNVQASISYTLGDNVEKLMLMGAELNGTGNDLDNYVGGTLSNNLLMGLGGNDTIEGSYGIDTMIGGTGNDEYWVYEADDVIVENADEGIDTIVSAINYTLGSNLENLNMFALNSVSGTGNELDNVITGAYANNILTGLAGNDTLNGMSGSDTLIGGIGNDTYVITDTLDTIVENLDEGIDTVSSSINYTLGQNLENLTLAGITNINGTGNDLDNTITGNTGNNILTGGIGNDTYYFLKGHGTDTIIDSSGIDIIQFGTGIVKEDIYYLQDGNNLIVGNKTNSDTININNWYLNDESKVEKMLFDDGTLIDVNPVSNTPPTATLVSGITDEDVSVTLDVLANASDVDGDILTIDSFTQSTNGSITLQDNKLVYTPNANYNGTDNFDYTISDGNGGTVTKTVNLTINSVNDTPIAAFISGVTDEDTSVLLDILAQASDIDGDILSISNISNPANGIAVLENNKIRYTPNANYNGTDNFDYTISDGNGGTITKTVNLTINPVNDVPTATLVSGTTDEDVSVTLDVLANASDVDGDILTIDSFTQSTNGSITLQDNKLVYTPNANYNGTDNFDYTISDGNGGTITKTVNLTINPVNDTPIATLVSGITDEDVPLTLDVLANASDVDGDILSIDSFTQGINGSITIQDNKLVYTPNANYNGTDSFDYTILDGNGGIVTQTVSLTINPVSDMPVPTVIGTNGNDSLSGYNSNDIYYAMKGNDRIKDYSGSDTYLFYLGDGVDSITDNSGIDTIMFGPNIAQADISFTRNNNNLVMSINNTTDSINIVDWFTQAKYQIEKVQFDNGSFLSNIDINQIMSGSLPIYGTTGDDVINGTPNNDVIYARAGNDTIYGLAGVDTMYGETGNDSYYIDNATDSIIENLNEGIDTVYSSTSFALGANLENLVLTGIDPINGTGNDLDNVITGNSGINILTGQAGNDTISGLGGNDIISNLSGNDTYLFNLGDGQDTLIDNNGTDVVKFGSGITQADLEFVRSGDSVIASIKNTTDKIIMENWFVTDSTNNYKIEKLEFSDGSFLISSEVESQISQDIVPTVVGTDGYDIFSGYNGNDIYYAKKGNDRIKDYAGSDTYLFYLGDGRDSITDTSGTDRIVFGAGISQADVTFTRNLSALNIGIAGTTDQITVIDWFTQPKYQIERVELNNGAFLTNTDINQIVQQLAAFGADPGMQLASLNNSNQNQDMSGTLVSYWQT